MNIQLSYLSFDGNGGEASTHFEEQWPLTQQFSYCLALRR